MALVSRTRPGADPNLHMILLHGLGSDEQDMYGLAEALSKEWNIHCLRAPIEYVHGFAWFEIDWDGHNLMVHEDQIEAAAEQVEAWIDSMHVQCKPVIGGFSQGAIMSAAVAARVKRSKIGGVVCLAGAPCNALEGIEGALAGLPVFIAHGIQDDVIHPTYGTNLRDRFEEGHALVEYTEYDHGHHVTIEQVNDLNRWLAKQENLISPLVPQD